jgi:hypothetical protein
MFDEGILSSLRPAHLKREPLTVFDQVWVAWRDVSHLFLRIEHTEQDQLFFEFNLQQNTLWLVEKASVIHEVEVKNPLQTGPSMNINPSRRLRPQRSQLQSRYSQG